MVGMDVVKTNTIHPATTVAELIKKIKESRTMNSLYGTADEFPDDLKKITVLYHSSLTAIHLSTRECPDLIRHSAFGIHHSYSPLLLFQSLLSDPTCL